MIFRYAFLVIAIFCLKLPGFAQTIQQKLIGRWATYAEGDYVEMIFFTASKGAYVSGKGLILSNFDYKIKEKKRVTLLTTTTDVSSDIKTWNTKGLNLINDSTFIWSYHHKMLPPADTVGDRLHAYHKLKQGSVSRLPNLTDLKGFWSRTYKKETQDSHIVFITDSDVTFKYLSGKVKEMKYKINFETQPIQIDFIEKGTTEVVQGILRFAFDNELVLETFPGFERRQRFDNFGVGGRYRRIPKTKSAEKQRLQIKPTPSSPP